MTSWVSRVQPAGTGKSSLMSSTVPSSAASTRARSRAATLLRFCHRTHGTSPSDTSSQSVVPRDQTSEQWLNLDFTTVSGAHQRVACGCLRHSLSTPSFKTMASPKSVTLTTVLAGSSLLNLHRSTFRQDKSACTMRCDSKKPIARESCAEAYTLCRGVKPGFKLWSASADFMEPIVASSCTTDTVRPSSMAPKISGTKGQLVGFLASIPRTCSSRLSPLLT
mmetsp:Transcript_42939/g.99456  ORF Transcript_42939/g.99456 Transcript_42939/m.99456 type:complete len:222 (+) Transcript_42939:741-1406(+)